MKPADVILQQLGGPNRLHAMIGAANFYSDNGGRTLGFAFKMCKEASHIKITLNDMDFYDIEFIKVGRRSRTVYRPPIKVTGTFENVDADNLRSVIENFTGLVLSLGTMKG
jgi:hypothetical protein